MCSAAFSMLLYGAYFTYTDVLALAPEPQLPPCLPREEWLAATQGILGKKCYRLAGTRPLFSLQRLFALGGGASLSTISPFLGAHPL